MASIKRATGRSDAGVHVRRDATVSDPLGRSSSHRSVNRMPVTKAVLMSAFDPAR